MKKVVKFITAFISLMLVLCFTVSCAKVGDFSINKKTVCKVGGEAVTYDDYKYFFYSNYISLYGEYFSDLSDEKYEKVKALTEDALRRRAVILQMCDDYGIKLSKDDKESVNEYVQYQIDSQGGLDAYKSWLVENRLTGAVFRSQVELTYFYDPYLRGLLATGIDRIIDMTDAAIIADVNSGNFYRYSQIYFEVPAGQSDRDAYDKITVAYQKLQSGASFETAANATWASTLSEMNKYKSEWRVDVTKGVYVAKGEKEAILEDAVLALEDNEYTQPIWSGNGWHIFIRLPFDMNYAEENLYTVTTGEKTLAEQSFARRYLEYIENESKNVEIDYKSYFTNEVTFEMLVSKEELN